MLWTMRDPKRFLLEREELDRLSVEVEWIEAINWRVALNPFLLEVDLDLMIHGLHLRVVLTYPDAFPFTPAYIRPRDKKEFLSIHQYGPGGSFCLEWRADNWQATVTGADLVRSLYKLISSETHPENPIHVPSAHRISLGQETRSENCRLVATLIDVMNAETIRVNDLEMHYEIDGTGQPLLLLHGGTGSHQDWVYAGRGEFVKEYSVIAPDARGHGATSNPRTEIMHRQCALDTLSLLDHLGISKCRAIGLSMGGNILLHMATMRPDRLEAMIVVSAILYFPEQARAIMRQVPAPNEQPAQEWERMRRSHNGGDQQITTLWDWTRGLQDSYDDMNFTPPSLSRDYGAHINNLWRSRSTLPC